MHKRLLLTLLGHFFTNSTVANMQGHHATKITKNLSSCRFSFHEFLFQHRLQPQHCVLIRVVLDRIDHHSGHWKCRHLTDRIQVSCCVPQYLSCIVSKIRWDSGWKLFFFYIATAFDALIMGTPTEFCHISYTETRMVGLRDGERQFHGAWHTDRWRIASHHTITQAALMHSVAWQKNVSWTNSSNL